MDVEEVYILVNRVAICVWMVMILSRVIVSVIILF